MLLRKPGIIQKFNTPGTLGWAGQLIVFILEQTGEEFLRVVSTNCTILIDIPGAIKDGWSYQGHLTLGRIEMMKSLTSDSKYTVRSFNH